MDTDGEAIWAPYSFWVCFHFALIDFQKINMQNQQHLEPYSMLKSACPYDCIQSPLRMKAHKRWQFFTLKMGEEAIEHNMNLSVSDGWMDGWTNGHSLLYWCVGAPKNQICLWSCKNRLTTGKGGIPNTVKLRYIEFQGTVCIFSI